MQTLVRVVVALVIVLLLLVVVVPLQLVSMLVENDPESEPGNESKSADDLESQAAPTPAARAAAHPRRWKRRLEFAVRRLILANDLKIVHFTSEPVVGPVVSRFTA